MKKLEGGERREIGSAREDGGGRIFVKTSMKKRDSSY